MGSHGVAWLVVVVAGCQAPELARERAAIRGGSPTGDYPAVVAIGDRPTDCGGAVTIGCTGILIAPRVVLTAAHCVDGGIASAVAFGADSAAPDAIGDIADYSVDPAYDSETGASDLALILLARAAAAVPATYATSPVDAADVGRSVDLVGFGATDETGAGVGVKRAGTSVIREVTTGQFRTEPGPSLSCAADSGGPILDPDSGAVIGVTGFGDLDCELFASNVDVGTTEHRAFIDAFVAAAGEAAPVMPGSGALCAGGCDRDEDCPFGFTCDDGRCAAPAGPGDLGATCATATDCGGETCAHIPAGDCRCLAPCDPPDGCGCRGVGAPSPLWLALVLLAVRRRRVT